MRKALGQSNPFFCLFASPMSYRPWFYFLDLSHTFVGWCSYFLLFSKMVVQEGEIGKEKGSPRRNRYPSLYLFLSPFFSHSMMLHPSFRPSKEESKELGKKKKSTSHCLTGDAKGDLDRIDIAIWQGLRRAITKVERSKYSQLLHSESKRTNTSY